MAFNSIVGQDKIVMILRAMVRRQRPATTFLFCGPYGTGKKETAVQFIRALNCLQPQDGDSCDICKSCRKMKKALHPDFRVVKPEDGLIKIEQVRECGDFLVLKSTEGRYKAILVEDADRMNAEAANAFLKTLEEPPANTIIILLTVNEEGMLDTIRSRCLRLFFAPLSLKAVQDIARQRGIELSDKEIKEHHGLTGFIAGELFDHEVVAVRDRAFAIFREILSGEPSMPWKDREEMRQWLEVALTFVRDMAMLRVGMGADVIINTSLALQLSTIVKNRDVEVLVECYEKLMNINKNMVYNLNKSIVFNYARSLMSETFGRINS
ncbi:MAG: DNA polymerase III subunit delta' [Candidatus Magnetoovum sp. WYHC-5]|nr:DNA polymerase III subunit delta' [Candidatus Magnetoovum sp. WYHC-5]